MIAELLALAPFLMKFVSNNSTIKNVADVAINIAKEVTKKDTAKDAVSTLKSDPVLLATYQEKLLAAETEITKAYFSDLDSARKMQIAALQQEDVFSKRFIYYFAIGWSIFACLYFLLATFLQIPTSGQRVADTILGVLVGTVISGFFNFFFGSSARSAKKDETIFELSRQ